MITAGGVVNWLLIIDAVGDISTRMSYDLMPISLEDIGGMSVMQIGLLNSLVGVAAVAFTLLVGSFPTGRKNVSRSLSEP